MAVIKIQTINALGYPVRRAKITPSWAEHGIAKANNKVVIILSFFVSWVLVTTVAIVSQPNPRTIGITALPLSPIFLKTLSISIANLGK